MTQYMRLGGNAGAVFGWSVRRKLTAVAGLVAPHLDKEYVMETRVTIPTLVLTSVTGRELARAWSNLLGPTGLIVFVLEHVSREQLTQAAKVELAFEIVNILRTREAEVISRRELTKIAPEDCRGRKVAQWRDRMLILHQLAYYVGARNVAMGFYFVEKTIMEPLMWSTHAFFGGVAAFLGISQCAESMQKIAQDILGNSRGKLHERVLQQVAQVLMNHMERTEISLKRYDVIVEYPELAELEREHHHFYDVILRKLDEELGAQRDVSSAEACVAVRVRQPSSWR